MAFLELYYKHLSENHNWIEYPFQFGESILNLFCEVILRLSAGAFVFDF